MINAHAKVSVAIFEVFGRPANSQFDFVSASASSERTSRSGSHHFATQLLHKTKRRGEFKQVYFGESRLAILTQNTLLNFIRRQRGRVVKAPRS